MKTRERYTTSSDTSRGYPVSVATRPLTKTQTIHAAVVHAVEGPRFLAADFSLAALTAKLAQYVETNAANQLWPDEAERVQEFIARDRLLDAIDEYFVCVGERWGVERLHQWTVEAANREHVECKAGVVQRGEAGTKNISATLAEGTPSEASAAQTKPLMAHIHHARWESS